MMHSCDSSGTATGSSAPPSDSALDSSPTRGLILYLDFDGVLHHDEVYWSPKVGIHMRAPGRELFEWMPILENLLLPHPDVHIVLSTSWVRVKGFGFAKKQLTANLQSRVVGATFHKREMNKFEFDNLSRGSQIFADVQRRRPEAWFAIDNDAEAWPHHCLDHLIKTEDYTGLSNPRVQAEITARLAAIATCSKHEYNEQL